MFRGPHVNLIQTARKVAVLRASRIGDFVCATPALRALRAAVPAAEISLIALPLVEALADRCRHIDRFEPFPGFPGMAEQYFEARRSLEFLTRMQAERFDLVLQMHGSGVYSNPIALMLGGSVTAGFVRPGDGPGRLDAALPQPAGAHEVRRLLALLALLDIEPRGEELEFALWPEDHTAAEASLDGLEPPLIALHPAAREKSKRWPAERFVAVAGALRRRHGGTIVILGGPEEARLGLAMAQAIGGRCRSLAGRLPLPVLGAVIARLDVLLGNDSGPAHIAYALGAPTVTIFGGTDPAVWGPLTTSCHRVLVHEIACRPCEGDCPIDHACLKAVSVDDVVSAADGLLFSGRARARRPARC